MRLLHAGPDRLRHRAAERTPKPTREEIRKAMAATSAAAAPIRRSSAPSCAWPAARDARLVKPQRRWRGASRRSGCSSTRPTMSRSGVLMAELDVVGRPTPRQDGAARAAGRARFTVDVRLPGMLHAACAPLAAAHGRVRSLDLDAARATSGVRAVVGPETGGITSTRGAARHGRASVRGAPIAVVAADDTGGGTGRLARAGARARCRCHTSSIRRQALNEQRFRRRPDRGRQRRRRRGAGRADVTVEFALDTPGQLQTPLEPHAAVAWWEGDQLTVWVSTQGMFAARDELAQALRPPQARCSRAHRVRRRRLRRQAGRRVRGARGRGTLAAHRPARSACQRPPRRAARRRPPRRHAPDRAPRRRDGTARSRPSTPTRLWRWARVAG